MVQKSVHYRVDDQQNGRGDPSWEVFVRPEADDALHHTGTIRAPSERVAYDRARRLFAWFAHDLWLCPAGAVRRYSSDPPSNSEATVDLESAEEPRAHDV